MKKEVSKKNTKPNKEEKYKIFDSVKLKRTEFIITLVVGVIFLVLLFFAITNEVFMPAALISFALFLFCICYYYIDDEKKKKLVYTLFGLGVLLIIIEVIYTIIQITHLILQIVEHSNICGDFGKKYGSVKVFQRKFYAHLTETQINIELIQTKIQIRFDKSLMIY